MMTYKYKKVVDAEITAEKVYKFTTNDIAVKDLSIGDLYTSKGKLYRIVDFRPPNGSSEPFLGDLTGEVTTDMYHPSPEDARFIVEPVKTKKYTFIEDKDGSYIRTMDGTFVNCTAHQGIKYRLEVTEE